MFSVEKDVLHEYREGSRWAQVYRMNSGHYLVRMFDNQIWQEDKLLGQVDLWDLMIVTTLKHTEPTVLQYISDRITDEGLLSTMQQNQQQWTDGSWTG